MKYTYATLLLNETGAELNEEKLLAVLEAAEADVTESRVKAMIAASEDLSLEEYRETQATDTAPEQVDADEDEPEPEAETEAVDEADTEDGAETAAEDGAETDAGDPVEEAIKGDDLDVDVAVDEETADDADEADEADTVDEPEDADDGVVIEPSAEDGDGDEASSDATEAEVASGGETATEPEGAE